MFEMFRVIADLIIRLCDSEPELTLVFLDAPGLRFKLQNNGALFQIANTQSPFVETIYHDFDGPRIWVNSHSYNFDFYANAFIKNGTWGCMISFVRRNSTSADNDLNQIIPATYEESLLMFDILNKRVIEKYERSIKDIYNNNLVAVITNSASI